MFFFRGRSLRGKSPNKQQQQRQQEAAPAGRIARACMEVLEERQLLANPVVDPIDDQRVPGGKALIVPVTGADEDGDKLTYTVTSSNGEINARVNHESTWLKMTLSSTDGNGQPVGGDMVFQLFGDITPNTVRNIVNLVRAQFYNGLKMHRLANLGTVDKPAYILQGGDQAGTGSGSFPHRIDDEYHRDFIFSGKYQLAMAKSTDDSNGSQFFITQGSPRHLDFDHTIFGQMVRGFDVMDDMVSKVGTTDAQSTTPKQTITITNVELVKNKTDTVLIIEAPRGASGTIRVRASDGTNTDTQSFDVRGVVDTANNAEPFMRAPVVDRIVAGGEEFFDVRLKAFDLEGDANLFNATLSGAQNAVYGFVENDLLRIVPNKGYRGPLAFDVWVYRSGGSNAQTASMDSQRVVFMVGEDPINDVNAAVYNGTVGTDRQDTLLTFRDTNPNGKVTDFAATINWGDGTAASTGTITQDQDGTFRVRGTHKYSIAGNYKVIVTIQSNENAATGTKGTLERVVVNAEVEDAALTGKKAVVIGDEDQALSNVLVGTFTTTDTRDTASDFLVTVNWGDGTTTSTVNPEDGVVVSGSAGTFTVRAVHTYTTPGAEAITVTVKDKTGGATTVINSEAFIDRTSLTVGSIQDLTVVEATTDNYQVDDVAVNDTEDGHTYTARVNWGEGDADDFEDLVLTPVSDGTDKRATFDLKHTYAESGAFEVTVIVTDEDGNTATQRQTISVSNKPPTLTSVEAPSTAVRGETITIRFNGADDVSETDDKAIFRYEVDWGDGNKQTFSDASTEDRLKTATHVYMDRDDANDKVYTIKVRAMDEDMTTSSSENELTKSITVKFAELRQDPDDANVSHLYIGGYNQATSATVNNESRPITEEIQVLPDPDNAGQIKVVVDNHLTANDFTQSFAAPSGQTIGRIIIFDGAGGSAFGGDSDNQGNDLIRIDPAITNDVELYGSTGNDTLIAAGGDDILYGGLGDDELYGKGGRDVIVGGSGNTASTARDLLNGGDGEDILVGGTTVYDTRRDVLRRIADEWNRSDLGYADRLDHITGETDGGLNDNFRLRAKETNDDFRRDVLRGEGGRDVFFYTKSTSGTSTLIDVLVDAEDNERQIEQ